MKLEYEGKKEESEILERSKKVGINKNIISEDGNTIFHGDNFEVLSLLNNSGYSGKIDLIYIDPPFATNNDFMIDDNSGRVSTISYKKSGIVAYSDKISGDGYIEFIRERLILLRELLSDKGSIYLHIDYKIGHYVKVIMDEVFGKSNFLNDISRRKSNPKNFSRKAYGNEKDMILFYAKNKGENIFNNITVSYSEDELKEKFKKVDSEGNYYNTVPIHAPGESSGDTGKEWEGLMPPSGRHWRTSPEKLTELNNKGMIEWSSNGNPRLKKFAKDSKGKKIQDIWLNYKDKMYPSYPTEKNRKMLEMIIRQSSNEDSIVLDAFAGSGGTLISASNLNRKFIGIDKSHASINIMKQKFSEDLLSNVHFVECNDLLK